MKTSKNIAELKKFGDSIYYGAHCDCGNNADVHTLLLERDKTDGMITMNLYAKVTYDFWIDKDEWYKKPFNIWRRIKKAVELIYTGYLEAEGTFVFGEEDSIRDYINALEEGIDYLKEAGKEGEK